MTGEDRIIENERDTGINETIERMKKTKDYYQIDVFFLRRSKD
jgi:hypothetical protein